MECCSFILFFIFRKQVYTSCQESYRLTPQGSLNVPPQYTDEFCDGPCLEETNLVLKCIENIMYSFHFYDGATVHDVRYALTRGCGQSAGRGNKYRASTYLLLKKEKKTKKKLLFICYSTGVFCLLNI